MIIKNNIEKHMEKVSKSLFIISVAVLLYGCSSDTRIQDISEHPRDYVEKKVSISGKVTEVFSLVVISYFSVDDGTGSMMVVTNKPLPQKGETIKVGGTVQYFSIATASVLVIMEE